MNHRVDMNGAGGASGGDGPYGTRMPYIGDLDELVELVIRRDPDEPLYVRWSTGPDADLGGDRRHRQSSRDALTGVPLPGLSVNSLRVEPWWGDRPLRLWVARRLYDYRHLAELRGPGVRPWVLVGEQCGRGPDNEPLVVCHQPVAWVADEALRQSQKTVEAQGSTEWGPLHRAD